MNFLSNIFSKIKEAGAKQDCFVLSKDEMAELLKVSPEALKEFEEAYKNSSFEEEELNFFKINAKQASNMKKSSLEYQEEESKEVDKLIYDIVHELLSITAICSYDGNNISYNSKLSLPDKLVSIEDIIKLPENIRPQLTGTLLKKDLKGDSIEALLWHYKMFLSETDPKKKSFFYNHFRQGLDILDLDALTYEVIGMNLNSIGNWFPGLINAVKKQNFFKVPKTTIIKVPLPLLQLTRVDYGSLTSTTMKIIDEYCMKAFNLDENKSYHIKTGTYSSKFDFRNAKVTGAKEVRELGEYLLFIHFQALQMASPLSKPCIYGVSTTNEWVVREFIEDVENNPTIYNGMPLHTEYRVFVDFDTNEILGINPYWDPDVMKKRFGHSSDSDTNDNKHDYIIYSMHEEILMKRYNENKDVVVSNLQNMLSDFGLTGQWSIDVMQNGNDFYIIDMALAVNSALVECVPNEKLKKVEENWIPKLCD